MVDGMDESHHHWILNCSWWLALSDPTWSYFTFMLHTLHFCTWYILVWYHIIKGQGTFPRGPKTRFDWLDKLDARLPPAISPSATFFHCCWCYSALFWFYSLTCCVGTNLNRAFFSLLFCGFDNIQNVQYFAGSTLLDGPPCWIYPKI